MKKYLIIGASAAGIAAATKLRQLDPLAFIECISQEKELPYNKCFLADYFSGKKEEHSLFLKSKDFFEKERIVLTQGLKVVALNKEQKHIIGEDGQIKEYDALLVATGSSPFIPFDVVGKKGIFTFNTLGDVVAILAYMKAHFVKNVVIIGAGLSGLECADSLLGHGLSVTLVEKQSHVLKAVLHEKAASFLEQKICSAGVTLLLNSSVSKIVYDDYGTVTEIITSSGLSMKTELVVVALGVRPNSLFLEQSGIVLAENKALFVNDYLQSSDSFIYGAGDIVMVKDKITGRAVKSSLWPDALQQGICAASNMAGMPKLYEGVISSMNSAFFGIKFHSSGDIFNSNNDLYECNEVITDDCYSYLLTKEGIVRGFIFLGNGSQEVVLWRRSLINQKVCS